MLPPPDVTFASRGENISYRQYRCRNEQFVEKIWELKAIGIQDNGGQVWTTDERAAVSRVEKQESTENEPKFYNNYEMACSRLENLEKSLRKKGDRVATE